MFASAGKALGMIFDPAFFGVLIKGLILTVLLFVGLFVGMEYALDAIPKLNWEWVNWIITGLKWIVSVGFFLPAYFHRRAGGGDLRLVLSRRNLGGGGEQALSQRPQGAGHAVLHRARDRPALCRSSSSWSI